MNSLFELLFVTCVISVSILAATPDATKMNSGMMTAQYTETPPVIDGILDDACWKQAIEITPFISTGTSNLATEQTSAWLVWDESNIYVAYKCLESCLEPLANRRHQFADKLKEHDSKEIWYNDSVALVICKDKGTAYEFVVNASGTVTDSIMKGEDIWETRDPSWESGIKPVCKVYDGFWTVEYAIPFSVIKESPDGKWRFIIGRVEAPRKENSNWNGCPTGFHDRQRMGELYFGRNLPRIGSIRVPTLASGKNDVTFMADETVYFQALLKNASGREELFREASATKGTIEIKEAGKYEFNWMLSKSQNMEPFAVWPKRTCNVMAEKLEFAVENGEVTLNGSTVSSGAVLNNGINTISVSASAKGSFTFGEMAFSTEDGWVENDGIKKRTILLEEPIVFPEWRPEGLTVSEDDWMDINLVNRGVKGFSIPDLEFVVDMPDGFTLTGATGLYKVTPIKISQSEKVTHDSMPYTRYRIKVLKKVNFNPDIPVWQTIVARFHIPAKVSVDKPMLYVSEESASLAISMLPVKIPLIVTPHPVGAKLPDDLRVQLWLANHLNIADDKSYMDTYLHQFERIGISEVPEIFQKRESVNQYALITFESWGIDSRKFLEKHSDMHAINFDGKEFKEIVCADVMLHDAEYRETFKELVDSYMSKHPNVMHVCWDFEANVFGSHMGCVCQRCIKAFRTEYPQVPEGITPEVIRKDFRPQWISFTNRRMAAITGMLHKELHRNRPDILFSVYSGYQNSFTNESYGIDWNLMKGNIDIGMCGYGRPLKDLEATRKALGDTPLVIGLISTPYARSARQRPSAFSEAALMRAFCDSTSGVLLYAFNTLDARSFCSLAAVSKIISVNGEFIRRHDVSKFASVKPVGIAEIDYSVLQGKDGSLLISFMNLKDSRREFKVELPDGYTKKAVQATLDGGKIYVEKVFKIVK